MADLGAKQGQTLTGLRVPWARAVSAPNRTDGEALFQFGQRYRPSPEDLIR